MEQLPRRLHGVLAATCHIRINALLAGSQPLLVLLNVADIGQVSIPAMAYAVTFLLW